MTHYSEETNPLLPRRLMSLYQVVQHILMDEISGK